MYKNKYYQDHRDEILEQKKEYYNEHKDELNKKSRQYYHDNKDKFIKYRPSSEQKTVYNKTYYDKHKDVIYNNLYKDVYCPICDRNYKNHYLSKHKKSKRHHKNRLLKDPEYKKHHDLILMQKQVEELQKKILENLKQ